MTSKTDEETKDSPSRLAHELLLNTMEKLAEDDADPELARRIQRQRAQLNGASTLAPKIEDIQASRQEKKPCSGWRRRLKLIAAASITLGYLALTSPDGLVVLADGSISGVSNIIREKLQGPAFWKQQLAKAQESLKWELAAPQRRAESNRKLAALQREWDRDSEETYRRFPSLRPSAAERDAEALREKADRIEEAEMERWLENDRVKRIAELKKIISHLKRSQ